MDPELFELRFLPLRFSVLTLFIFTFTLHVLLRYSRLKFHAGAYRILQDSADSYTQLGEGVSAHWRVCTFTPGISAGRPFLSL